MCRAPASGRLLGTEWSDNVPSLPSPLAGRGMGTSERELKLFGGFQG